MPYRFNPFTGKLDIVSDTSGFVKKTGDTMTGALHSVFSSDWLSADSSITFSEFDLDVILPGLGKVPMIAGYANVLSTIYGDILTTHQNLMVGGTNPVFWFIDETDLTSITFHFDKVNSRFYFDNPVYFSSSVEFSSDLLVPALLVGVAGDYGTLEFDEANNLFLINFPLSFNAADEALIIGSQANDVININRNTQYDGCSWIADFTAGASGITAWNFWAKRSILQTETFMNYNNNGVSIFSMDGYGNMSFGGGEAGVDHTLTVQGETNDIILTFDEDLKVIKSDAAFIVNADGYTFSSSAKIGCAGTNPFITTQKGVATDNAGFAIGQVGKIDFWDFYCSVSSSDWKIDCISDGDTFNGLNALWITNANPPIVRIGYDLIIGYNYLNGNDPVLTFGDTGAGKLTNKGTLTWKEDEKRFDFSNKIDIPETSVGGGHNYITFSGSTGGGAKLFDYGLTWLSFSGNGVNDTGCDFNVPYADDGSGFYIGYGATTNPIFLGSGGDELTITPGNIITSNADWTIQNARNITLSYPGQLRLRGTVNYINSATAGYIDIVAGTGIRLNQDTYIPSDTDKLWLGAGNDMSIGYDGTDGNIKTSDVAASDLVITCGANKTIELTNSVYKDINIAGILLAKPTSSAPGTDTFRTNAPADTGILTYAFAEDEMVHGGFELQHDYKEGTDLVFHVHFQIIAAPTGTDNVQWRLTYVMMRDGVTLAAVTTIDSPDTAVDTQYRSYRTDFGAITGTNFKIGDQMMFTLTRVAATGDAFAGDCLIETAGIHYEIDTLGSRQIATK